MTAVPWDSSKRASARSSGCASSASSAAFAARARSCGLRPPRDARRTRTTLSRTRISLDAVTRAADEDAAGCAHVRAEAKRTKRATSTWYKRRMREGRGYHSREPRLARRDLLVGGVLLAGCRGAASARDAARPEP